MQQSSLLLLGIHFTMVFLSSSELEFPFELAPSAPALELMKRAETSRWNRELLVASNIVSRRRKRRRKLELHRRRNEMANSTHRGLQDLMGGKYNDYLPEDNPELLNLDKKPGTKCLSPLQKWFVSLIESIGIEVWDEINTYNITSLAYLYKHHVDSSDGTNEYFGTYGERADEMKENHENLKSFWSRGEQEDKELMQYATNFAGGSSNVLLLGMHGVDLAEDSKIVPTLQQMYNLDGSEAYALARKIQAIISMLPGAFNNPVLTANAVAIQSLNPDGSNSDKDSIIIGDGVFAFLDWLKLSGDGSDYIHSHEFGHHLQYDLGVDRMSDGGAVGEETRRWEMMADAFGSYFLAHAQGGRLDVGTMAEVHRAAFSLGDCEDAIGSHHGTPRQRECASNNGAKLARGSYLDNGRIIPPVQLMGMFDQIYSKIVDLDEEQCDVVVDKNQLDETIYGEFVHDGNGNMPIPEEDLEVPSWYVPAPSPGGAGPGRWPPSGYEPYNAAPQGGWDYGASFEAYDPNGGSEPEDELDKPPPRVQNGTYAGDDGWFGRSESQWVVGRTVDSRGSCLRAGWAVMAAVLANVHM